MSFQSIVDNPDYSEFISRAQTRIGDQFSLQPLQVRVLHSSWEDKDHGGIHAVFCYEWDLSRRRLFITGVNIHNGSDYEISNIGDFDNDFEPCHLTFYKMDDCIVYTVASESEVRIYNIDYCGTVVESVQYRGQEPIQMIIPQPIDILRRTQNNLLYFWVGYKQKVDLISFELLRPDRDSIKTFESIIVYDRGILKDMKVFLTLQL